MSSGNHSDKWYQREFHRTVCLSGDRARLPDEQPTSGLRSESVTDTMRASFRLVASVFPGTRIEVDGVWRPIQL